MKMSVRSILDPSRVHAYSDESVFGLDAADHVLVSKDRPKGTVLGFAPNIETARPSFWRRAAIQAVAHVLVHLLDPRADAALVDEHLQENAGGVMRRFQRREYRFFVNGRHAEFVDAGHSLALHIGRSGTAAPS